MRMITRFKINFFSKTILFLGLFFFTQQLVSQNNVTLDSKYYLSVSQLNALLDKMQSAPYVTEGCIKIDCKNVNTYYNSIFNLRSDLSIYHDALDASKNVSKRQWFQYLDDTYKNENLKWALITNLRFRDAWTNFSSSVLDLSSLWNAYKTGSGLNPNSNISQFEAGLTVLDGTLSSLNVLMKTLTADGSKNIIGTLTSDDWNNIYSGLRSTYDLIVEAKDLYKKVDKTIGLSTKEIAKLKSLRRANIAAAIVQFVNIYVSYQNKQMKEHIEALDKVLSPNQKQQSFHYDKYILKQTLGDIIEKIEKEIRRRYDGLFDLNLRCNGLKKRAIREDFTIDNNVYGDALKYYKPIILSTTATIESTWKDIDDCIKIDEAYSFVITDGVGKTRTAFIEVIRLEDNKQVYRGTTNKRDFKLKLFPEVHKIKIFENYLDNIRSLDAIVDSLEVANVENNILNIDVYGRIEIKVTDKQGNPVVFRYKLKDANGELVNTSFTAKSKPQVFDVQFGKYNLELAFQNKGTKPVKQNIIITAKELHKLHYIYEDEKFEEVISNPNPKKTIINVEKSSESPLNKNNTRWINGTLYNSLDGTCRYKNNYLVIMNQGGLILNLETGEISDKVLIAPGKSLKVAVSSDDPSHFLRAYISNSTTSTNNLNKRISFWLLKDATNGWWYAAGCNDGTKPTSNCDNGNGKGAVSYSCQNFGID